MSLDEETLERVAQDGQMNYDAWPPLVEPLLDRINHIAYHEFEIPRPYPILYQTRRPLSSPSRPESSSNEPQNATPTQSGSQIIPATPAHSRNLPPVPLFPSTPTTESTPATSQIADSLPPPTQPEPATLPVPLLQLLDGITKIITASFSEFPPHTVQRLAELVLDPKRHYRTLPAWLRALDRTVSVTSTADIFPLPKAMPLPSHVIDSTLLTNGVHESETGEEKVGLLGEGGGGILWMNRDAGAGDADRSYGMLGSDESLGGALLTPIPWLRNGGASARASSSEDSSGTGAENSSAESDDLLGGPIELSPSSSASPQPPLSVPSPTPNPLVPERQDGAVTQGELIRQEQEAGVVPVGHSEADSRGMMLDDEDDEEDEEEEEEEMEDGEERESEVPHARGPGLLGAVDVGRVGGKDVEVNLAADAGGPGKGGVMKERGVRDAQEVLVGGRTGRLGGEAGDDAMQVDEEAQLQLLNEANEADVNAPAEDGVDAPAGVSGQGEMNGDGDGDVVLTDADGKGEGERKTGEGRDNENVGADAVDATAR